LAKLGYAKKDPYGLDPAAFYQGFGAVTGKHPGATGQGKEASKAFFQGAGVAAGKVRPAYPACKKGVTGYEHTLLRIVQTDRTRRVAWGMEYVKRTYRVAIGQQAGRGGHVIPLFVHKSFRPDAFEIPAMHLVGRWSQIGCVSCVDVHIRGKGRHQSRQGGKMVQVSVGQHIHGGLELPAFQSCYNGIRVASRIQYEAGTMPRFGKRVLIEGDNPAICCDGAYNQSFNHGGMIQCACAIF